MGDRTGRASPKAIPPELAAEATWERLHERTAGQDDLDDDLRERALSMIAALRPILGDDWPARVYGSRNPLAQCLFNFAPHAIASMVQIGEAIIELRDVDGWSKVVGRVRGATDHEAIGAVAEVTVAFRAFQLGLSVAFDPATDRGRHADIVVEDSDRARLYIEVCVKNPIPDIAKTTETVENTIIPPFDPWTLDLMRDGRILRAPEEWEVAPLKSAVAGFLREAASSSGVQTLTVPGLLELRVIRIDDPGCKEAQEAGIVGDFGESSSGTPHSPGW